MLPLLHAGGVGWDEIAIGIALALGVYLIARSSDRLARTRTSRARSRRLDDEEAL